VVHQVAPSASIMSAGVPSSVGAAMLALREIGVPFHDKLLENVRTTLPRLGTIKS